MSKFALVEKKKFFDSEEERIFYEFVLFLAAFTPFILHLTGR